MTASQTPHNGWRRSSRCTDGTCLEVTRDGDDVLIRDSAQPAVPPLRCSTSEFGAFLAGAKAGEFDDLVG